MVYDQLQALKLALATVELCTGNGAQSNPWPDAGCLTDNGDVDYEEVAKVCREALVEARAIEHGPLIFSTLEWLLRVHLASIDLDSPSLAAVREAQRVIKLVRGGR